MTSRTSPRTKRSDISPRRKISAFKTFRGNINALRNNRNIEYVEFDQEVHALPLFRGSDSEEAGQNEQQQQQRRLAGEEVPYGITMVKSAEVISAADRTPTPKKICVVDTGYDVDHEDLPVLSVPDDGFSPYGDAELWYEDGHGHGTHCAGTIGAIGDNGVGVTSVNPDESKFSFFIGKGLTNSGSGSTSGVIAAVEACRDAGASVISMSLGGSGYSSIADDLYKDLYKNDDVLIIAAAGNGGNDAPLSYPASYNAVMSVAAVDSNKNKAGFSQFNEQVESKSM